MKGVRHTLFDISLKIVRPKLALGINLFLGLILLVLEL
jgi:hypothetical protein